METLSIYARPFFEWLLRSTFQAGIVVCLILLIQALLRNQLTARWHYALWLILVVRMVLPWAPQSRFSIYNLAVWEGQSAVPVHVTSEPDAELPGIPGEASTAPQTTASPEPAGTTKRQDTSSPAPSRATQASPESAVHKVPAMSGVLPLLWLAGALLLGGYILICNVRLWRAASVECPSTDKETLELLEECRTTIGLRTIVALVPSEKVNTPILLGFVRPRLLIPKGISEKLSREELRYVFLHELAHVKRHDIALGWLTALLQVLHWFNPLVWLAFHRMRSNRESACDALVLSRMQGEATQNYGLAIVSLLEHFSVPQALPGLAGILESKSQLKRRIAMISQFKHNSYRWSPLTVILIMLLGCVSLPDARRTKAGEDPAGSQQKAFMDFKQTGPVMRELKVDWTTGGMALSPDGRKLAYCRGENGRTTNLVLRDLESGDETDITPRGTFGTTPVFSPDGNKIAYTHWSENNTETIVHIQSLKTNKDQSLDVEGFVRDWSRDGRLLLISTSSEFSDQIKTSVVPVDGGRTRKIAVPSGKGNFSPDAQYITYSDEGNIHLYELDSRKTTVLTKGLRPIWCPDGTTLLFARQQAFGPEPDMCLVSVIDGKTTGEPQVIKPDFTGQPISLSQTGRLLYSQDYEERTVCAVDIDPETGQPIGELTRLAAGGLAVWSPDGTRIAYVANNALRVMYADGSNDHEIMKVKIPAKTNFVWSPDGENIYMPEIDRQNQGMGLNALSLRTRERRLVMPGFVGHLTCSPDGKHIAFIKLDESSKYLELFMIDVDGTDLRQLTFNQNTNRYYPAWSPDGKQIAFDSNAPDGTKALMAVSVEDGEINEIFRAQKPGDRFFMTSWCPDGEKLIWCYQGYKIGRIKEKKYQDLPLDMGKGFYTWPDWSPDGKKLLFSKILAVHQLMIMENFLPTTAVAKPEPMTTVRRIGYGWRGPFANLSPDGKYMSDRDWDTGTLVVHELATGKSRTLVGRGSHETGSLMVSAISPDSREVAYLWWDPNTGESRLYCAGLDGSGRRMLRKGGYPMPRDWSADGQKILATVLEDDVAQMVWISRSDGSTQHIADVSLGYLGKVDISSDGRFIAYDRPQGEDTSKRDIFVFDLRENREHSVINHPADDKLLGWTPDGRYMFFASNRTGTWDAWLLPVAEGKPQGYPELARHGIGNITPIGFTPQGSYYYGHEQTLEDVFMAKLDLESGEFLSEPVPVFQSGATTSHDWSPDGRYLAYCEQRRDESQAIHIRTLANGRERTLAENLPYIRWLRWSPDNRSFLIDGYKRGDSRGTILKIDARTGERTDLVRSETEVLIRPEMSRDGRTLFYTRGNDPRSGTVHLMARDLESGREKELFRAVSPARLMGSVLSPDGQRIVLSIVPSQTGPEGPVLRTLSTVDGQLRELLQFEKSEKLRAVGVTWMPDSRNVLFWKWFQADKEIELWRISAEGGEPRKLCSRKTFGHIRVHPDGQRIAFYDRSTTRELWVMENFLPEVLGK